MTRIRATCPTCGDVDLRPDDIEVQVVQDPEGEVTDGSTYRFACPACTYLVTKPADDRIVRLLSTGGVAISVRTFPTVAAPPRAAAVRVPPLTHDDLLTFHELLQTDGWFEDLTRLVN